MYTGLVIWTVPLRNSAESKKLMHKLTIHVLKNLHMVGEETHNLELEGTASYAVQTTNYYPEVSQLSPGFCDWIRQ